jgi:hypothetical protein
MTIGEFAEAAARLRRELGASEDSGGRTDAYEASLPGGIKNGPHPWDLGRDWVYGTHHNRQPNNPKCDLAVRSPRHCPTCSKYGLKLIHEPTHDHVQPADFPADPVTEYDGAVKDWT